MNYYIDISHIIIIILIVNIEYIIAKQWFKKSGGQWDKQTEKLC